MYSEPTAHTIPPPAAASIAMPTPSRMLSATDTFLPKRARHSPSFAAGSARGLSGVTQTYSSAA